MPPAEQRRLAAILAADVAGYSRAVAQDEAAALAALRALRRDVLDPAVAAHGGRLFKAMGDGFLVEFPSTVQALRCALAVQARPGAADPPAALRIGVHVGDVVVEGEDLLGDGVNVAARLQTLAAPGGVCLSARVREDAAGRVPLEGLEDLGEPALKNIPAPVRAFRLGPAAGAAGPAGPSPAPAARPPAFDRPALAVLPFDNMSGDPEQDYFADGITEELITQLSRARWFYVIARNSTFTYRSRAVDIRQVGRELGARYVLEGSVRRAGGRVRITAQLIEAETGHHAWADRFDGALDDIFELQDRVAEAVAGAIEPSLQHAEVRRAQAKPTGSLTAYDLCLRALPRFHALTREGNAEASGLLRRAMEADPGFAMPKAMAAMCVAIRQSQGWADGDDGAATAEGIALARAALAGPRENPAMLRLAGHALAMLNPADPEPALAAMARARALNPNSASVLTSSGWVHVIACQPEEALEAFERGMRLSPLDPEAGFTCAGMAAAHLMLRRPEQALAYAARSMRLAPNWGTPRRLAIVAAWELGREDEARALAAEVMAAAPGFRVARAVPRYRDAGLVARYRAALLGAGLPA